jgi:hypothetical protein
MHRGLRQTHVPREFGLIDELPQPEARGPHDPAEIGQRRDRSQIQKVALEIGADISVEPHGTLGAGPESQGRRGIPAPPGRRSRWENAGPIRRGR